MSDPPGTGKRPPDRATELWGPEEMLVPAPVATALSAGAFAVLALVAVLLP